MCELKVYLDGKKVFEDAIYAKSIGGNVTLRSVLGETKEFENCLIAELDVTTEKLNLTSKEP